jgi:hypothetical protein
MSEGRPTAVRELTYDVDVLPLCPDKRTLPPTTLLLSAIHSWTAKLTELCNQFSTINSLCISTNARLNALIDLDNTLMRWKDHISAVHQPGRDVVTDWDSYMLLAPLHLDYFNLLMSIHWACRMTISPKLDAADDQQRRSLRTSDMRCLSAARSFVQVLNRYVHITKPKPS